MLATTEFTVWDSADTVPVVQLSGDPEFAIWDNGVPVCDVGVALGGVPPPRRRVFILD